MSVGCGMLSKGDYLDKFNLESIIWYFVKKLPESWYMGLTVAGSKDNDSWEMNFIYQRVCFDKAEMLAEEKIFFYCRAVAQLLILYALNSTFLLLGSWLAHYITHELYRSLIGMIPVAVNTVLCVVFLFSFHKIAFCKILFENDDAVAKKQYRVLGFAVKTLATIELLAIICRMWILFYGKPTRKIGVFDFINDSPLAYVAFACFAVTFLWYAFWYLRTKWKYKHFALSEAVHTATIYKRSGEHHTVELRRQFIIEKSEQQLYVGRIAARRNPDYKTTPQPYEVPLKDIERMVIGEDHIAYNFKNKKWETVPSIELPEPQMISEAQPLQTAEKKSHVVKVVPTRSARTVWRRRRYGHLRSKRTIKKH